MLSVNQSRWKFALVAILCFQITTFNGIHESFASCEDDGIAKPTTSATPEAYIQRTTGNRAKTIALWLTGGLLASLAAAFTGPYLIDLFLGDDGSDNPTLLIPVDQLRSNPLFEAGHAEIKTYFALSSPFEVWRVAKSDFSTVFKIIHDNTDWGSIAINYDQNYATLITPHEDILASASWETPGESFVLKDALQNEIRNIIPETKEDGLKVEICTMTGACVWSVNKYTSGKTFSLLDESQAPFGKIQVTEPNKFKIEIEDWEKADPRALFASFIAIDSDQRNQLKSK